MEQRDTDSSGHHLRPDGWICCCCDLFSSDLNTQGYLRIGRPPGPSPVCGFRVVWVVCVEVVAVVCVLSCQLRGDVEINRYLQDAAEPGL